MIALPPLAGSSNVSVRAPSPGAAENPVGLAGAASSGCTVAEATSGPKADADLADRFGDFFNSGKRADRDVWFPGAAKAGTPSIVAEPAASASAPTTESQRRWHMSGPRPHRK